VGLEFLDKNDFSLLKVGIWNEDNRYAIRKVFINEDERIYGIKSGRRGVMWAYHFDV
jgi:hypothetical protein